MIAILLVDMGLYETDSPPLSLHLGGSVPQSKYFQDYFKSLVFSPKTY